MIFIWALAGITSILLDIIMIQFYSIGFIIGTIFAMLAVCGGYSIPAQFALFIYMSICAHVLVFPVLNKKKKLDITARNDTLQNYILSEYLKDII